MVPSELVVNPKLIFDVGQHRGEDTDFYLSLGYDVVAFEADPKNVQYCKRRFNSELASGCLTIVEGAIVAGKNSGEVIFYQCESSVWGTVDASWKDRNQRLGAKSRELVVEIIDFSECLRRYGVPLYLKIDIEGMDIACLESLAELSVRPEYVSLESNKVSFRKLLEEFSMLTSLGYKKFAVVDQADIGGRCWKGKGSSGFSYRFSEGASGPFGHYLDATWHPRWRAILIYGYIFGTYKLFGDDGLVSRHSWGKKLLKKIRKKTKFAKPRWYDTHARF